MLSIQEEIEFKLQFQHLQIQTLTEKLRLPVSKDSKIEDVLKQLSLSNHSDSKNDLQAIGSASSSVDSEYALHFPNKEVVRTDELAWDILKNLLPEDKLTYRPKSKKALITFPEMSHYIEVTIDYHAPLETLYKYLCRKLGLRYDEFRCIKTEKGRTIPLDSTLAKQRLVLGAKITIEIERSGHKLV